MDISNFENVDEFSDYLVEHLLANGTYVTKEFNNYTGLDWPIDMDVWKHNMRFGLPSGLNHDKFGTVRAFFYDLFIAQQHLDEHKNTFVVYENVRANNPHVYTIFLLNTFNPVSKTYLSIEMSRNPLNLTEHLEYKKVKLIKSKVGTLISYNQLPMECKQVLFERLNSSFARSITDLAKQIGKLTEFHNLK